MEMRWRALRVSGSTNVAKYRASRHTIPDFDSLRVGVEMCIVVNTTALTDHGNGLTAEVVLADPVNVPAGRGKNRCAARRKDVLAFMPAACAARRLPRVCNLFLSDVFERHRDPRVRLLRVELQDACIKNQAI